jgi:hypothetical protein
VALPPLRPAAFFWAVVPPCDEDEREDDEPDFFPPRLDAPGEFAIFAARSFDIPLSFSASYCFSFFTFARFAGTSQPLSSVCTLGPCHYPCRRRGNGFDCRQISITIGPRVGYYFASEAGSEPTAFGTSVKRRPRRVGR